MASEANDADDAASQLLAINERLVLSNLREQEASEVSARERKQLSALVEALHEAS